MGSESFIATNYRKPIIRALSHPSHLLFLPWPSTWQRLNTTIQGGAERANAIAKRNAEAAAAAKAASEPAPAAEEVAEEAAPEETEA